MNTKEITTQNFTKQITSCNNLPSTYDTLDTSTEMSAHYYSNNQRSKISLKS